MKIIKIFPLFLLLISCKHEEVKDADDVIPPNPLLIGTWFWDKTEKYNLSDSGNTYLEYVKYPDSNDTVWNQTGSYTVSSSSMHYETLTLFDTKYYEQSDPLKTYYNQTIDYGGNKYDTFWYFIDNGGLGKDYIFFGFSGIIFTLDTATLIIRSSNSPDLAGNVVNYFHKL